MDFSGLYWTSVDNGLWTVMDVSGSGRGQKWTVMDKRSFRHGSCTGFQSAKMYHAYSHIHMRRSRLTMLKPRLQPG